MRIEGITLLAIDYAPWRGVACGAPGKVISFSVDSDGQLAVSASEDIPCEGASSIAIR